MSPEDANFGQVEAQNSVHAVLHFQDLDYLPSERLARVETPSVVDASLGKKDVRGCQLCSSLCGFSLLGMDKAGKHAQCDAAA